MAMKFGLVLPYAPARHDAELARLAEAAGWDGVFLGDAIWCVDPMIVLTAAAMVTTRIRLGTLVIPMPLRIPWKLASESAALDNLSDGRLILGLGTGAVWMGWQCFPDEVTDTKARAEMLDEGIDILTLLFQGKQFDYDGRHYHVRLTQMEERHFPAPARPETAHPLVVRGGLAAPEIHAARPEMRRGDPEQNEPRGQIRRPEAGRRARDEGLRRRQPHPDDPLRYRGRRKDSRFQPGAGAGSGRPVG